VGDSCQRDSRFKRRDLAIYVSIVATVGVVLMVVWHRPDDVADIFCGASNSPLQRLWNRITTNPSIGCRDNKTEGDLKALTTQLMVFEAIAGRYPTQQEGVQILLKGWQSESGRRVRQLLSHEPIDEWGRPYQYRFPAKLSKEPFDLFTLGPDGVVSADDVGNWND
jgi:type II secretion system protein G